MADVPPLRVRGYVKYKLVPFRFEKDTTATPEAFKARAQSFEADRGRKPETLSLVSSLHGGIERILFTIPGWVFSPGQRADAAVLATQYAAAFRHILSTLPIACRVVLFTHEEAASAARTWLAEFNLADRSELVTAPDNMSFTFWAEDAYCICKDPVEGGKTYFVEPASFDRERDADVAELVAPKTRLEVTHAPLYFQGGNVLVGDDFWMIGGDHPAESLRLGFVVPRPGETELQAIARTYGSLMDHQRSLIVVESRVPVPARLERAIILNGEPWQEVLHEGNTEWTKQPLFHIDMFISLAGCDGAGVYHVLVGSPRAAAEILGEPIWDGAMQAAFDDIAADLQDREFRVHRNPLPLCYDDDDSARKRHWYFASGNNVLVQDHPRRVWLPTYGHGPWAKLKATDAKNRSIWKSLGYEVEMLPDFHPFAAKLGAAHCIKKYLARTSLLEMT